MSDENTGDFQSMLESLPDDLRSNEFLTSHKDFNSFAKSLAHNHSMSGRKGVVVPKDGDGDDVYSAYRNALGIPDSAAGYKGDGLGSTFSEEAASGLMSTAFEAGVSADGWEKIAGAIGGAEYARRESLKAQTAEQMASLKDKWGADYDANYEMANQAAHAAFGEAAAKITGLTKADGTQVGADPEFIMALHALGAQIGEGDLDGGDGQGEGAMSPEAAEEAIRAMWGDKETLEALTNERHPQHKDVLAKKIRLGEIAASGGQ